MDEISELIKICSINFSPTICVDVGFLRYSNIMYKFLRSKDDTQKLVFLNKKKTDLSWFALKPFKYMFYIDLNLFNLIVVILNIFQNYIKICIPRNISTTAS